jgi:zinc/manganese transport system permease protein
MIWILNHACEVYLPTLQVVWPALLVSAALAVAGGVVGILVILRREALLALALPQVVMLGAAIAMREDWPTLPPALATAGAAMGLVAWSKSRQDGNVLLPVLYIAGLSLSIILIANAGARLAEVQNLFTGVDVAVGETEGIAVAAILVVLGVSCAVLWRRWMLIAQAPAAAELARLHPVKWNALFLAILATVVIMATQALGTAMVVALLFLPAAVVLPWASRIPSAMAFSALAGLLMVLLGFVVSIEMAWPLSHSIAGAGVVLFLLSRLAVLCLR